jgi:hypothetical protein
MMRPPFSVLMAAYPRFVDRAPLFADIGWTDLVNDKAYWDTCAIRMSYALLHAGVALPGARMKANDGAIKGRYIEPGQARLSNILKKVWGQPEVYVDKASAQMGSGTGPASCRSFTLKAATEATSTSSGKRQGGCSRTAHGAAISQQKQSGSGRWCSCCAG